MNLKLMTGLTLAIVACAKPAGSASGDSAAAQPDTSSIAAAPDTTGAGGHHIPVDSTKPTIQPPIIPDDATGATAGATVTVAAILQTPSLTGKSVRVTGTCIGYRVPSVAVGSPPRTRSDWQLESSGQAVYVTGPLPTGCDPTAGSATPTTIVATVREDTLAALGGNPPIPRRYLEWKGP